MAKKKKVVDDKPQEVVSVLRIKRVRLDYEVIEEIEAGMVLSGS